MKTINVIILTLVVVGAINWGLIGIFNYDLVAALFGGTSSMVSKIIYTVVGIAGLWALMFYDKIVDES